jgi:D-inositol-3-phosphate glycosyltransferase
VIAAAVGGLPFIVEDGATGFLVDRPDPWEYAARLARLLAAPELGRRMGMAAASYADRFPWEATTSGLVDVYGELIPALGGRDLRVAP